MRGLKQIVIIAVIILLLASCKSDQEKTSGEESPARSAVTDASESSEPMVPASDPTSDPASQPASEPTTQPASQPPASEPPSQPTQGAESPAATEIPQPAADEQLEMLPKPSEEVTIEAADGLPIVGTFYPGLGPGPRPG
ncbi:MAG TPA: hypothetical protein VFI27_03580, partial [candidate division Zixibacteria bacterium]|nr:hypothetical protein [candidate division Zixibacteria bacterium]